MPRLREGAGLSNQTMRCAKSGLNSRKGTSKKAGCNPILCVLLSLIICAVAAFAVIGSSLVTRKQSEDILAATSNMLAESAKDLAELAAPLTAAVLHYSDGKLEGEKAPGLMERPVVPIVIGYAISLIKCSDKQSFPAGLVDAAIVMRHSVHMTSVRNPSSGSVYDYKMFAIVHSKAHAEGCGEALKEAGFTVLVRDPPVKREEIQGEFLRKNIRSEWCCGEDEFIKLHAYKIEEVPIVVHVDMDFIFQKPMDDLFDAMLFSKDSDIGQKARDQIPTEFPQTTKWPEHIDAFMTRDWPQVIPGRKAGYQAGFLVAKPNAQVFDIVVDVIRKGDYVDGYGRDNGWGGQGYGGFVGAKAMQGLMAYVYDVLLYDTWVELNQCRYNHMGMDVLYRAQPGFRKNHEKIGQCRNDRDYCEDCMHTEVSKIYNIHYNQCRKPWNCIGEGSHSGKFGKTAIPEDQVHLDHCMELMTIWHDVRTDLETKLLKLTGDKTIEDGRAGDYKKEVFHGHCKGYGGDNYLSLAGKTGTFQSISDLYKKKK